MPSHGNLFSRRFALGLLAIAALWLVLRLVYWNGYYTEDAPGYVTDAIWMARGAYHARDHVNGLNVGTYLPVALPLWIFGKSEVALAVWPMLCSLLGLLSLAGLGRILFGEWLGLLAALLYATSPGDVFFSTVVMPDALQAGWLSFSVFLIAWAYVRTDARLRLTLVGAGLALGVCHLIRANDVLLFPVGVFAVAACSSVWKRRRLTAILGDCSAYLAGWVAVTAIEGVVYLWAAGDFLLRFHVVDRHYGSMASIAEAGLNTDPRTIPYSIFAPLEWWTRGGWGVLNPEQAYHGLIFCWAFVFLLVGAAAMKSATPQVDRAALAGFCLACVWFAWPLLYHQFGSQSLTHFVPMHRLSRHLVVYVPGAILATIAGAFVLSEAARTARKFAGRELLASVGIALLVVHGYFNWKGEQIAYDAFHRIKDTYVRVRGHLPDDMRVLAADPGDLGVFDFWLNPLGSERVRMVAFAAYASCNEIQGAVVLTQSSPGWEGEGAPIIRDTLARLPCLAHPPETWRLLYDGSPERLFQAGGHERDARD